MTRRAYTWLLVFALLGLGASSSSAWVHYNLLKDPSYTSVCDVSAHVSCTEAYLSPWGSMFGTPVAILGVLFFVFVAGLVIAGRRGTPLHQNLAAYVSVLSTIGLAFVLYLAYGAFFVLKEVCMFCVATYVAVIGLFAVSTAQSQVSMSRLPQRLARDLRAAVSSPLALAALLVFVVAAASAIAFFPKDAALPAPDLTTSSAGTAPAQGAQGAPAAGPQDQRTELERWWDAQPRTIVPVGDTGGAAVVIVKFNDFQCPPCRNTYYAYKPILEKYQAEAPGKVLFLLKDYPLDPECNENAPGGAHLASCEAAAAIRLARAENKPIEKLEEYFYDNQQTLTPAAVRQAVKDNGMTDFDAKYPSMLQQVKTDIALGKLLGVGSTPTFFINGVKFPGGIQPQHLDAIIAYELKKAAAGAPGAVK